LLLLFKKCSQGYSYEVHAGGKLSLREIPRHL